MARVLIGDTEYDIPELNFVALERAWPYIELAMQSLTPLEGPAAGLRIVAAGIVEREDFNAETMFGITDKDIRPELARDTQVFDLVYRFLARKLKATQISNIRIVVQEITKEAGLIPEEGEKTGETETLSTETSPPSSQSSLPLDMKAEAGTA